LSSANAIFDSTENDEVDILASRYTSPGGVLQRKFIEKLRDAIESSGTSQTRLAEAPGYGHANIISMFKSGNMRVPPEKIPGLTRMLGLDSRQLVREWLAAYEPELLDVIEGQFGLLLKLPK
jgi:hypothetical protein